QPAARLTLGLPIAPCELQAGFDRLGSAVAEKRARQARQTRKTRGQLSLKRMEEQVRCMQQLLRLIRNGRGESGMRVPERGDPDAGDQVQIAAAVRVKEPAPAPALEDHRSSAIDLQQVLLFNSNNVGDCGHSV